MEASDPDPSAAQAATPRSRLIRTRRWPRRLLIGLNVLVAVCVLSAGALYGYVRHLINSIHTVAAPHLTATAPRAKDSAAGLPPENILLIGNETRSGLTNQGEIAQFGSPQLLSGSLSDVIMILHLDPVHQSASLLSIPRDLFLPMPPGSPVGPYQKIDAALNDGANGPDNLIHAISSDLGIPINHYVELEFDGFQRTVNALGGIKLDFPEKLWDANSLLYVPTTGCVQLNGSEALALVRARHLQYDPPGDNAPTAQWPYDPESDLSRIVRDHVFLRVLAAKAESQGLSNPFRLNDFLNAIIAQITIDPGLKNQLIKLASHYRHVNPSTVPETTLPITTVANYHYNGADIGDVDFPTQPEDNNVIAAWDGTALPAPTAPKSVSLYNFTSSSTASSAATALAAAGVKISTVGSLPAPAATTETFVQYPPGGLGNALFVMRRLSGAVMLDPDSALAPGTVSVDFGSSVSVVAPTPSRPPSSATPPTSIATPPTTVPPTTVPAPGGLAPSSSSDVLAPWDPRACPAKA